MNCNCPELPTKKIKFDCKLNNFVYTPNGKFTTAAHNICVLYVYIKQLKLKN